MFPLIVFMVLFFPNVTEPMQAALRGLVQSARRVVSKPIARTLVTTPNLHKQATWKIAKGFAILGTAGGIALVSLKESSDFPHLSREERLTRAYDSLVQCQENSHSWRYARYYDQNEYERQELGQRLWAAFVSGALPLQSFNKRMGTYVSEALITEHELVRFVQRFFDLRAQYTDSAMPPCLRDLEDWFIAEMHRFDYLCTIPEFRRKRDMRAKTSEVKSIITGLLPRDYKSSSEIEASHNARHSLVSQR